MQPQTSKIVAGVVVSVVLVMVLAVAVLRPTRTEVVNDDPQIALPEPGGAIVAVLRESSGLSVLGITIRGSEHHVEVQFLTGPDCAALLNGNDPWPTSHPECSAPVELVGEVGATGITQSGDSLVGVEFEVPGACFEQLEPGMQWPPDLPDCAER